MRWIWQHTSEIASIDDNYTKPGHADCNNSANGSVVFIKVVLKDSSVFDSESKNESDMSKIKLVSTNSKEVSSFQSPICDDTSKKNSETSLK